MTNWTKGPWHVVDDHPDGACYEIRPMNMGGFGFGLGMATVYRVDEARDVANAHLIAAAPELYEALESIMLNASPRALSSVQRDMSKKALSKARGEEA